MQQGGEAVEWGERGAPTGGRQVRMRAMEIHQRARRMETVRERDERDESMASEDGDHERRITGGPRMRIMGQWCKLNLLRFWWMQVICILCALAMVIVVGVVVYRSAMINKRQEILLKCENRKEVSRSRLCVGCCHDVYECPTSIIAFRLTSVQSLWNLFYGERGVEYCQPTSGGMDYLSFDLAHSWSQGASSFMVPGRF